VKSKAPTHKSPSDAPPGTRQNAAYRGAPKKSATVLDPATFHANPKGGAYVAAPHGVEVLDNKTKSTR
jgi:hypothetical protein